MSKMTLEDFARYEAESVKVDRFIVCRLGYWGLYPVRVKDTGFSWPQATQSEEEIAVSDTGIRHAYCYTEMTEQRASVVAEHLRAQDMSVAIYKIPAGKAVTGDTPIYDQWQVLRLERSTILEKGITLFPDRSMGQEIECPKRLKAKAEKLAAQLEYTIDDLPGVKPLARVRRVTVKVID